MAKKIAIRITKKVQPESACPTLPKISTSVNLTFRAFTITPTKNTKEKIKIPNNSDRKKVVKEVIATKEVLNCSEKLSPVLSANFSSTSILEVL